MNGRPGKRFPLILFVAVAATFALVGLALAVGPNVREVKPAPNVQDPDDISNPNSQVWVLDFRFKDPRLIKVNVPGRGQKVCWYLWYQVINNTKEPRTFYPDFELVTQDKNTVHHDQILPQVQEAIRKLEDPTDYYKIKNTVSIYAEPIPVSLPNATPRAVTGVAIWDDADIAESNRFSIFVTGLSNGYSLSDVETNTPTPKAVVRRKTLQLNFRRVGDRYLQRSDEIRPGVPPWQWIYRGSALSVPGLTATDISPR
jgi:hypothetical protein